NVGDHQHHELHRSSPWSLVWPYNLSRLAAPEFDTHSNYLSSFWSRRSKFRGSCVIRARFLARLRRNNRTSLSACRTRRGGESRRPARCVPRSEDRRGGEQGAAERRPSRS